MSASPFAFYRGTAALMADDLASGARTDILVASCGDAHDFASSSSLRR
ncbi:DUF2252 family protein [Microbacterium sp. MRS-1]|nr:DUF2252 family protein [Microbacterium sp. MRS-1]EXJ52184.1 hypothetical protein AS96_05755 [Microbacterium sp. MRS-1]